MMPNVARDSVYQTVRELIEKLAEDWEYDSEITQDTLMVADLGLESIDVVVLGTTIQNEYDCTLPLAEFMAEVGQREQKDIRIGELVDFVHNHLQASANE